MSAQDRFDAALPIALALVGAVHDEGPDVVAQILIPLDREQCHALAVALAALVPDDRSAAELLAWSGQDVNEVAVTRKAAALTKPPTQCRRRGDIDPMAVERVISGDTAITRPTDVGAAVRAMTAQGMNAADIAARTGWSKRTVTRHRRAG